MMTSYPKLLYIAGYARSGTTVLGKILNEYPGLFFAGELRKIWRKFFTSARGKCGCGQSPGNCPVWIEIMRVWTERAQKAGCYREPRQIIALQNKVLSQRYLAPLLLGRRVSRGFGSDHHLYIQIMQELYASVAQVADAHVVIDSSKWPMDAALLYASPLVQSFFVHLVRHPQGVTNSRQKVRTGRLIGGRHPQPLVARMRSLLIAYDCLQWSINNWAVDRMFAQLDRSLRILYEEFANEPQSVVEQIVQFVGERADPTPFVDHHTVSLQSNHIFHGNKNRFDVGEVQIYNNNRQHSHLTQFEQVMVNSLTLPLRRRYGI